MLKFYNTKDKWPLSYIILTSTIPSAITGADVAVISSMYSYLSDISSVKHRAFRIAILEVSQSIANPFGKFLGILLH